jgi:hypothetical protein
MIIDTKLEENKEVSEREKLKWGKETKKQEKQRKRVEETGNCTKSLEITKKSAIYRDKDSRLNN